MINKSIGNKPPPSISIKSQMEIVYNEIKKIKGGFCVRQLYDRLPDIERSSVNARVYELQREDRVKDTNEKMTYRGILRKKFSLVNKKRFFSNNSKLSLASGNNPTSIL